MINNWGKSSILLVSLLSGCASNNNLPIATSADSIQTAAVTQSKEIATQAVVGKLNQTATPIKFSDNTMVNAAVAKADVAFKTNQPEKAYAILKEVTANNPADKASWLRMAQAQFDGAHYGEAIVNALEVLKRDNKDQVAKSIIVVSGLRLSTKTLADLRTQNEISGSLRTEAQDLAKILRENLGEAALVAKPQKKPVRYKNTVASTPAVASTQDKKPAAPPPSSSSANPFGALK